MSYKTRYYGNKEIKKIARFILLKTGENVDSQYLCDYLTRDKKANGAFGANIENKLLQKAFPLSVIRQALT